MPEWSDRLVVLQEAAAAIRSFEIHYVPGLLQTSGYTRAGVRLGLPTAPGNEVRGRVELRTRRAQLPQCAEDIDETEEYRLALDRLADEAIQPRQSIGLPRRVMDARCRAA